MRVAIFDFDGTLYREETFRVLMDHLREHPKYNVKFNRFYRAALPRYVASKLKLYSKAKMKEQLMQFYLESFEGLPDHELSHYFDELAEKVQQKFNQDVVNRLNEHLEDDVQVYLVSGAYTQFLHSVTKGYTFHEIIGTDIHMKENAVYTKTSLQHIQGVRKKESLFEAIQGKDVDWSNSFAYGDSYSDISVLELVGNPVVVNPEEKLKKIAEERGWEIL